MTALPTVLAVAGAGLLGMGVLHEAHPVRQAQTALVGRTGAPAASPTVVAASHLGPCARGAVSVEPLRGAPLAARSDWTRGPADGRIAFATIEVDPSSDDGYAERGSIVVVAGEPSEARAVATITGREIPSHGARVIAWTPDGERVLVWVGRWAPGAPTIERTCGNLFMVDADGSEVTPLTENGPGEFVVSPALSPDGRSVAYVQDDALWVVSEGRAPRSLGTLGCEPWALRLTWHPTSSALAHPCDDEIRVHVLQGGTVHAFPMPFGGGWLASRWSADGTRILVAVGSETHLRILSLDPRDGATETAVKRDFPADRVSGGSEFSPDLRWLLAWAVNSAGEDEAYVIDVAAGTTERLPWRIDVPLAEPGVGWLPGGFLYADDRSLYRVDLGRLSREVVGRLPVSAFAWLADPDGAGTPP